MKKQYKAGVILSYTSEIIKILSALFYTPIMLRLLGQSEYGLYQLVHSFVAYLGLLSFGFSSSYVKFFSKLKAEKDEEGIFRLNGLFMTVFLFISCLSIALGWIMVANIRQIFASGLTDSEYETARTLMLLMVVNLAITFPNSVFTCITSAHEKFIFQRLLIVLNNLFNPILTIPLLLLGYGSIGIVAITTCLTIGQLIANIWFVCVRMKEKFIFGGFDFSLFRNIWGFTFFIFLNQIIDQINWSVDRFLLGRMIGTTAVAIYGLGAQINTMYVMFSSSISSVFIPRVNKIVAETDDKKQLSLLFSKVGRFQFMVLILVLSGFFFFGKPFMRMWGGNEYAESYYVALLLIIPVTVPLIQNIGIEVQRAKNKHRARAIVYFFIAIGNIFISIPLINKYGPIGASAGTAVAITIGNILFMNWYYYKHIGIDIPQFWFDIISFFPSLIIPCIIGIILKHCIQINSIVELVGCVAIYMVSYFISMWMIGMNEMEKRFIFGKHNR